MLGYDPDRLEVLIYQLVYVVEGGAARQSSKRRGDVVFLRELVEKIGIDAARWYLVSRGHDQPIDIDVDLAKERSEKNPVYYVQYAHARIAGILRNAGEASANPEPPPTWRARRARQAAGRVSRGRRGGDGAPRRTRSRPMRSGSPTTSTASTTTACSRASSRRFAWPSCWRRRTSSRARSTWSESTRPTGCRTISTVGETVERTATPVQSPPDKAPDRNLALELVRARRRLRWRPAAGSGGGQERRRPGRGRRDADHA